MKGVAAAVPWLFMALIFVLVSGDGTRGALIGTLIIAPIPIIIAAVIPMCPHPWVNYLLVPILFCAVPVFLVHTFNKVKNKKA